MFKGAPTKSQLQPKPERELLEGLPALGPMTKYLGPRYTTNDLIDDEFDDEVDRQRAKMIRAFPVICLEGTNFRIGSEDELLSSLETLLRGRIPGVEWVLESDWSAPFLKYGIVHGSIPAPPDERTGDPMSLEIYCHLEKIDGVDMGTESVPIRLRQAFEAWSNGAQPPVLEADMRIVIVRANYANVAYPGVGVPFYM